MSRVINKTLLTAIIASSILAVSYYVWTWSYVLSHFGGDNATYVLTANYLSPYTSAGEVSRHFAAISQYPPLYPLLLAFTGGGDSMLAAHIVTTTCLLLAFLVLYLLGKTLTINPAQSLTITVLFALLPGTYFQALSIHSENMYLLVSLLGLYLVANFEQTGNSRRLWQAAMVIACASLVRTAGISLVVAYCSYLLFKPVKQKYRLMIIAIVPLGIWLTFQYSSETSYLAALSGFYTQGIFTSVINHLGNQSHIMLDAWVSLFTTGIFGKGILYGIFLFCLVAAMYRLWQKKVDGFYVILYLAMIIIWPYPAEAIRFLFPIVPILLIQTVLLIYKICTKFQHSQTGIVLLFGCILFAITLPDLLLTAGRFNTDIDPDLAQYRHTYAWYTPARETAIQSIKLHRTISRSLGQYQQLVPADECVFSIKPSLVGLYMGRISYPIPGQKLTDEIFNRELIQGKCNYLLMLALQSPSYTEPLYPLARLNNRIEILGVSYIDDEIRGNPGTILAKIK